MAYYLPKNILPENSLGCHFLLRCSLSCVLIIGPRSTREFSTIICWYYSRYSLVRYRFLVRFHRFFRGLHCSFDIGPHLFTCLRNWTIFDGGGWPLQFFGSNIFNSKWKVRKCWNHGNNFFQQKENICVKILSFFLGVTTKSIRCHFRFHLPNSFLSCEFTFLPSANIFTKGSTHEIWFLQQLPGIYSVIGTLLISSAVVSSGLKKFFQNLPIDHQLKNTPLLKCFFPTSIHTEIDPKSE